MSQEAYEEELLASEMEVETPRHEGTPAPDVDVVTSTPAPAAEAKAKPQTTTKRFPKLKSVCYTTRACNYKLHAAMKGDGCQLCRYVGPGKKEHCKEHLVRFFCPCGLSFKNKAEILTHVDVEKKWGAGHSEIVQFYEVCPERFIDLIKEQEFEVIPSIFGPLRPMGGERPIPASSPGVQKDSQARPRKRSAEGMAVVRDVRLEITEDQRKRDVEQIRTDRLRVTVEGRKQRRVECCQEPNSSAFSQRKPIPVSVVPAAQSAPSRSSSAATELDVLRQERDRYKRKNLAAKKALTRAQDSLGKMGDMHRLLSSAQAAVDQALGM